MSKISSIFNIATSGMNMARQGIATAGHNIANANTEGYSRQRMVPTSSIVQNFNVTANGLQIGDGVMINRIERHNDNYLENQINQNNANLSHYEEKDFSLRSIEDIFNEMNSDGMSKVMHRFFNAFRMLSDEPESLAIRETVKEHATTLVETFNESYEELERVRSHIDSKIEAVVSEFNSNIGNYIDLNRQIQVIVENQGSSPNDLLDKRDVILRKLHETVALSTFSDAHGHMTINLKGAGPVATGQNIEPIKLVRGQGGEQGQDVNSIEIILPHLSEPNITHKIHGGKLGAMIHIRDQVLTDIKQRLNLLASELATQVNNIHETGYNLGNSTGISFFDKIENPAQAARSIALSKEVKLSSRNIAAASEPSSPGDNRVALKLAHLQNQRIMNGNQATFDDWHNSIVTDIGILTTRNADQLNQQKEIVGNLNKLREQICGVSIDEETANLMQLEQIFGASARVIQIADEMLKTVMSLVKT